MKKLYVITMPDGSRWGIPAEAIATNYAAYCTLHHKENFDKNYYVMMKWFDANDFNFADWAQNSMNWADVRDRAVRLMDKSTPPIDWEEGWMNGEYEYVTIEEADKQ